MKLLNCDICPKKDIPQNETIKIDGKIYCQTCFERDFKDQSLLENKLIENEFDPTICTSCSKDFDDKELRKISNYPICDDCEKTIRNKTFPTWVKAFFIVVVLFVVFSFFWNWKYFSAYNDLQSANEAFQNGNYKEASLKMEAASKQVNELEDLKTLTSYYKGVDFLVDDKNEEALEMFNNCKNKVPDDYDLDILIIQAKIGATFNNKDYKGYLDAASELLKTDTLSVTSLTSVASAYACLYAENGEEEDKKNSYLFLGKAKAIDSTSEEVKEYYNRVEHRINSRLVISKEEFDKKYPNGWTN